MRTPRRGAPRSTTIAAAAAGCFIGTGEIMRALATESSGTPAWRPVRAAAILAMAGEAAKDHVWMTREEFVAFEAVHFPPGKRVKASMIDEIGIGRGRRYRILSEGAPITKIEALAMAHYATIRTLPIPANDPPAFAAWMDANFGSVFPVTETLQLNSKYVYNRARGHEVRGAGRLERLPEAALIRALDWIRRVGPYSPYGDPLPAAPFPKPEEET